MIQYSVLIFLTFAAFIQAHDFQGWTQMPGAANEVSAKGNELWVINRGQQIFRWVNGNWQHIPGAAIRAGASPDGWSWVVNAANDIFRYNAHTNAWQHIGGKLMQISAASKDRVMGVNSNQDIFIWEHNAWVHIPGKATWAAICDNDERWVVNAGDDIFRWSHQINNWVHIPGKLVNIDCQSGGRIIGVNRAGAVFVYLNGNWENIPGTCTRATTSHTKTFCVNAGDGIFTGNYADHPPPAAPPGTLAKKFAGWTQMPGAACEISAKGNEVWVINRAQQIFRWVNGNWQNIPGAAVRAGASPDGWTWVVNVNDDIFRFNANTNAWQHIGGKLVQISAASMDRALGVNSNQDIFLWENNGWHHIPGKATWAAICDNDDRWVVNAAQYIYRWNRQTNGWDHIPGALRTIDCQTPDRVIGTDTGGAMYLYENGKWNRISGVCERATITHTNTYCVNIGDGIFSGGFAAAPAPAHAERDRTTVTLIDEERVEEEHEGGDGGGRRRGKWREEREEEGEDGDGTHWRKKTIVIEEEQ